MSINSASISGNLTRDAELKKTKAGKPILSFGVAVNDRRRNPQTNDWEDYPNFIDCVMFGSRAEALANYLTKGTKVAIEGKLRYSSWERDGQKRSKIEVAVDEIEFMSSRNGGQGNGGYQNGGFQGGNAGGFQQGGNVGGYQPAPAPAANPAPAIDASSTVYDDDIPF